MSSNAKMHYGQYKFDPVPFMAIARSFNRKNNGDTTSISTSINLTGQLVSSEIKGSGLPLASGQPSTRIGELDVQANDLRTALSLDHQNFIVHDKDGYVILSEWPKVASFNLDEGVWFNTIPYTITLEYEERDDAASGVKEFEETWSFSESDGGDNNLVSVTHNVSAEGFDTSTTAPFNTAFENARNKVLYEVAKSQAPYFVDVLNGIGKANKVKTEEINVEAGTYSVTETYFYAAGNYTETYNVSEQVNEDKSISVTFNGEVRGWGDNVQARYLAASGIFPTVSGLATARVLSLIENPSLLNPNPLSSSFTKDPFNGVISYSFSYDDRPISDSQGVSNEEIDIQFSLPADIFAIHVIPGRSGGPIIQNVGTIKESQKSVSVTLQYEKTHIASGGAVGFDFNKVTPSGVSFLVNSFNESFNRVTNTYTASKSWTYVGTDLRGFSVAP